MEFSIKEDELIRLSEVFAEGKASCHLTLSPDEKELFLSNYESGTVSVYAKEKGMSWGTVQVIRLTGSGPDKERQTSAHAHETLFDRVNDHLWVVDLGSDALLVFKKTDENPGRWVIHDRISLHPGDGPRHMIVSSNGKRVFVITELSNCLVSFEKKKGNWVETNRVCLVEDDSSYCGNRCLAAEVALSSDEKFIYCSVRGSDKIIVLGLRKDGSSTIIQKISSGGKGPRYFEISPDGKWLAVANQDSDSISIFERNIDNGTILETAQIKIPCPTCVIWRNRYE